MIKSWKERLKQNESLICLGTAWDFGMKELNKDEMEYMKQDYKIYLQDSVSDPNFEVTSIENFEEWAEEEAYWKKRYED